MQIQLKQGEIITALKQYITNKGIDLTHKTVEIVFTAGRKGTGLSADMSIEDADIPGFTDADEGAAEVAKSPAPVALIKVFPQAVAEPTPAPETKDVAQPEAMIGAQAEVVADEAKPAVKTSSLFG